MLGLLHYGILTDEQLTSFRTKASIPSEGKHLQGWGEGREALLVAIREQSGEIQRGGGTGKGGESKLTCWSGGRLVFSHLIKLLSVFSNIFCIFSSAGLKVTVLFPSKYTMPLVGM